MIFDLLALSRAGLIFKCTTVSQASDSIATQTLNFLRWVVAGCLSQWLNLGLYFARSICELGAIFFVSLYIVQNVCFGKIVLDL